MNYWIDSHAHLYVKEFDEDIEPVVKRCIEENVQKVVLPNIDLSSLERVKKLTTAHPNIFYPTVGLHPCDVKEDYAQVLEEIKTWAYNPEKFFGRKICAIGETGLDFYWDITHKNQQIEALKIQIEWAKELQLPIILHTRSSTQETIDLVRAYNDDHLHGVFHCFSGTLDEAEQILELGNFYLGVDGPLTYKNSVLPEIFKTIPLEKILLETDSPYLPPTPYRGKRNESSYLPLIGKKLAEVKGCSIEEVQLVTSKNTTDLFGL